MSAPSSSCEVVDLSMAAICDDATSRLFFSGGGGGDRDFSWPAAAEIESKLKQKKLITLCDRHGVPREFKPVSASILGCAACQTPPPGSNALCIYADALEAGMRFPLHDFYIKLLRHYGLAPSQLVPNAWKYMAAFVLRCKDAGVEPMVSVFRYFFSVCAHKDKRKDKPLGWHHFIPCHGRPRLFSGTLQTRMGWKARFFFLQSPEGMPWKCLVAWGRPRMEDARTVQLTDGAIEKLKNMPCVDFNDLFSLHVPPVGALTQLHMHSTPVPMVKLESAVASAQALALTSLHQLHGTFKAGARAASDGDDLTWRTQGKRMCRGLGPASMAVTPPMPQSFDISAAPPPQGMEMTPCETSFDGAWGSSEISMPSGICSSDALSLYDAMMEIDTEKARLQDEIAHLQGQLQLSTHREQQANAALAKFMDCLVAAKAENAQLKEKYGAEIANLNQKHASEVAKLQENHADEVAKLNEAHDAAVAWVLEEHDFEVACVKHAAEAEAVDVVQDAKKEIAVALFPDLDVSLL